ncbi:MAG: FAD-dependent oxidoreductase, partial [Endomicrobia bacterium]|nr:FAD-dependent oxidoreductase [Endomicrobiia bacterium]
KNIQYGYNAYFYYPKYGGIQSLIDNIANLLSKNKVLTSAKVVNIQHKKKYVEFIYKDKLYTVRYDKIISTIPLPQLGKIISSDNIIKLWTHKFKYTSVICYNIAINKPIKRSIHWIYFPDKEIPFYRVGFYHNVNKNLVPKNKGAVYVEVSTNKIVNETAFYYNIVKTLISTNIITSKDEILFYQFLTIPYAYVVYDKYREEVLPLVLRRLKQNDIYSIGRYGGWKYSYMSENIKDAIETVNYINER